MEKVGESKRKSKDWVKLKLNVATYWCHGMFETAAVYLLTPSKADEARLMG